ncbi:30S ribosomal protein S8 [Patescibacteria group bacterium]|nr:30S ribosomal protein S8 [Patescibacteria group bacterium]MBU1890345.1 30S ribosomal protein S8 [Patescibacteria group bacterium]
MITDPIADMLTQIRNVLLINRSELIIPFSKLKYSIAKILVKEGYLKAAEEISDKPAKLRIVLKYTDEKKPSITSIKRVSKPGRRVYANWDKLPWVLNNYGISVISTSHGMMTNRDARKKKVGGEIICEVY